MSLANFMRKFFLLEIYILPLSRELYSLSGGFNFIFLCYTKHKIQQNSTYTDAGYPDCQLSGSAWPFT